MVSVTSIVLFGSTSTTTSKFWMTSWRAAAGAAANPIPSRGRAGACRTSGWRRFHLFLIGSASRSSRSRLGGRRAETHLGGFAFGGRGDLEKLARLEVEHASDEAGRELRDASVEVADH